MNIFKDTYKKGVNLGGWLSQYKSGLRIGDPHFDNFIVEKDIEQISDWGMDHVRLPVDYMIFEDDKSPGDYDEAGLVYIDRCIEWCKKHSLNVILDLHHAPGYFFGTLDANTLFDDSGTQDRLINIWTNFAKRYVSERENVCFELLNEIVEPDSTRWNALAARLVAHIREIDRERIILIGGNNYNAVSVLKDIAVIPDDDLIVYTFHFYEPMLFTHQLASWNKINMDYGLKPTYPSVFPGISEFIEKYPEYSHLDSFIDHYVDKELLRTDLLPALDFMNATGKTLYCGEYGVIDKADVQSRRNWHRDFNELMEEYGIGRAVWTYKQMSFRFVDGGSMVADHELINIIK